MKRDVTNLTINPFRTAVPFWGQTSQISSSLYPEQDCGPKRVNLNISRYQVSYIKSCFIFLLVLVTGVLRRGWMTSLLCLFRLV